MVSFSITFIILSFLLLSYKITAFVNLWLTPLTNQNVQKQQQNR